MRNGPTNSIIKENHFPRVLGQFRPLYNSNVAKVFIVNCCKIKIFVAGKPKVLITVCKPGILDNFGYSRNKTSVNKNPILRQLNDRYFCHVSINKWFQIALGPSESAFGIFMTCF